MNKSLVLVVSILFWSHSYGAVAPVDSLSSELAKSQKKILEFEKKLIRKLRRDSRAKISRKDLREIIRLQKREVELTEGRIKDLRSLIDDLTSRREVLAKKIKVREKSIRQWLISSSSAKKESPFNWLKPDQVTWRLVNKEFKSRILAKGTSELEGLQIDLSDALQLEDRINEEKIQLAYILQELREQRSLIGLHRKLEANVLEKGRKVRLSQLAKYRELKKSEVELDGLIHQFNARLEFEEIEKTERRAAWQILEGGFARLKGKLPFPLQGKVVGRFGRYFEPLSKLHLFKKGIDIAPSQDVSVRAISPGRVVYSGKLPRYGEVLILDHGGQFYSLCAHLEERQRKKGDWVKKGDQIGLANRDGKPIYFEIRAGNVPVNPLQWVSN